MIQVVLSLVFLANATIDHDMTLQEQKETGVSKLSKKERKALQTWIENHCSQAEKPAGKQNAKRPLIEENLQGGRYLRLSDQSLWEIHPDDTTLTQGWLGPTEIITTQNNKPDYPYTLTNALTGSSVRAKRITQVPTPVKKPQPQQQQRKS